MFLDVVDLAVDLAVGPEVDLADTPVAALVMDFGCIVSAVAAVEVRDSKRTDWGHLVADCIDSAVGRKDLRVEGLRAALPWEAVAWSYSVD